MVGGLSPVGGLPTPSSFPPRERDTLVSQAGQRLNQGTALPGDNAKGPPPEVTLIPQALPSSLQAPTSLPGIPKAALPGAHRTLQNGGFYCDAVPRARGLHCWSTVLQGLPGLPVFHSFDPGTQAYLCVLATGLQLEASTGNGQPRQVAVLVWVVQRWVWTEQGEGTGSLWAEKPLRCTFAQINCPAAKAG